MTEDNFFERLRDDARQLRYQADDMMTTRIAARVRERIAQGQPLTVAQLLSRWLRPVAASLAALALAAVLGVQWFEQSHDSMSLDSMASNSVDVSMAGDTFSVVD